MEFKSSEKFRLLWIMKNDNFFVNLGKYFENVGQRVQAVEKMEEVSSTDQKPFDIALRNVQNIDSEVNDVQSSTDRVGMIFLHLWAEEKREQNSKIEAIFVTLDTVKP